MKLDQFIFTSILITTYFCLPNNHCTRLQSNVALDNTKMGLKTGCDNSFFFLVAWLGKLGHKTACLNNKIYG